MRCPSGVWRRRIKSAQFPDEKAVRDLFFIDEFSMITSKIWSVIRDIENIYGFKFVLFGDYNQLPSKEAIHYDILNSEVFSEICDGQMLELTRNYRAENDVDFKEFITDLRIIKNGGKPDFKTYGKVECRKSLSSNSILSINNLNATSTTILGNLNSLSTNSTLSINQSNTIFNNICNFFLM